MTSITTKERKWGEAALEHRFKKYGTHFKNQQHIRNNPHEVWDLALRGIMFETPAPSDLKKEKETDDNEYILSTAKERLDGRSRTNPNMRPRLIGWLVVWL
jgi:hypothetical protein